MSLKEGKVESVTGRLKGSGGCDGWEDVADVRLGRRDR